MDVPSDRRPAAQERHSKRALEQRKKLAELAAEAAADDLSLDSPWLRTPQAAAYCGFSRSNFEKRRCAGTGPPYRRLGRRVCLYARSDLDEWLRRLPLRHSTAEEAPLPPVRPGARPRGQPKKDAERPMEVAG